MNELGKPAAKRIQRLAAKRMRMLRLGAGWSAEKLSQEYAMGGAGDLARTTIAKIESDKRQIQAGEVEGVARVFGLTSADLLDPDGPSVLLSYAEQDDEIGQEVSAWLTEHGFRVLSAGLPAAGDPERGEAQGIGTAQAFVALLSPSFLSSSRCQQQLGLAVRHQQQLLSAGLGADFIHVLRAGGAVVDPEDYGLAPHAVIDLAPGSDRSRDVTMSSLGVGILAGARASASWPDAPPQVQAGLASLDRSADLDRVLTALRTPSGVHIWLVISPPGFGKSWLLAQLKDKAAELPADWRASMVGLRSAGSAGAAMIDLHDATAVIRSLFMLDPVPAAEPEDDLRRAAQAIVRSGRPWLCLLDDAELLPARTVIELRLHLGRISSLLQDARSPAAALAFVVASRRDDGWKGITPGPQLSVLPLAGLAPGAIQSALEGLTGPGMPRPRAELGATAELVERVTEGMPTLVQESFCWIQDENWLQLERLEKPHVFDEAISHYIQQWWLAQDSLLPGEDGHPEKPKERLDAIQAALRALVPYRFITPYHVRHHLDIDRPFRDALKEAGWSPDDLWQAIADMALLYRPLVEPWQEIHPAIRRLLFRYFVAPDERAGAHAEARKFTKEWADLLTGGEQVIGLVESIWHEAARLKPSGSAERGEELATYAREVSRSIKPSAYARAVPADITAQRIRLQDYAAQRMESDEELQREVAGVEGLFETLVGVVRAPESLT